MNSFTIIIWNFKEIVKMNFKLLSPYKSVSKLATRVYNTEENNLTAKPREYL